MGLSYVTSAFAEPTPASDDSVQVVPEGTRGRLFSVWYIPASTGTLPPAPNPVTIAFTLTLRDGDDSGTVIFDCDGILQSVGLGVRENSPFSFPRNGILFTNGLNAVVDGPGMLSITVTYSGEG